MYLDANQVPSEETLRAFDICIVGAGAAGIALAARLIPSTKKVLLITSGSPSASVQSPADEAMYQGVLGPFMKQVDPNYLTRSRLRMYGGSTNKFKYWTRPLDEADLKPRPGYRDASWPLDIAELNRYYPDANDTGHFGPFNYDDIEFWAAAMHGAPFPSLPGDSLQNAIFHRQDNDKISHFRKQFGSALEAAKNITVLFNANALKLRVTDDIRHVTALECASIAAGRPNQRFHVMSRSYVLAQGGIEVVRLLKLSGGLGDNAKGQLGRGFMLHPWINHAAAVTFSDRVHAHFTNFYLGRRVSVPRRLTADHKLQPAGMSNDDEVSPESCQFDAWGTLAPKPEVMTAKMIGNFRLILRFRSSTFTQIEIAWEQVPNENSTITLDPEVSDPMFDQPVVRLDWNLLEQDKRTVREGLDLCRQHMLARDGGAKFEITTDLSGGPEHWTLDGSPNCLQPSEHHMGAAHVTDPGRWDRQSRFAAALGR